MGTADSLSYARKVFEQFKEDTETDGSLFMFNSLIRGFSSVGNGQEAISLYIQMVSLGIVPDKFTFPFLVSGCSKIAASGEGIQVHGGAVKLGYWDDVFIQNSFIHFYAECGDMTSSRKVFDEMRERNVVSWTSLICGYARLELERKAVDMFLEMVASGVSPNSVTMVCVISACAKLQDIDFCERISRHIHESRMDVNVLMVNALVDMYVKCGFPSKAKQVFDGCVDKNLVLCNTMMSNYMREGMAMEALAILDEIWTQSLQPDRVTMLSAISASAQIGNISCGKTCHGYVLRNGLEGWENISNAMIDMYMKFGNEELACRIFDRMINKNVVTWNSMIAGFGRKGDIDSAWDTFKKMSERDLVSWNTMIGVVVQGSMFAEAIDLFRLMQREGVKVDKVTMVSVASACGYLGALDLAKWVYAYIKKNEINCDMQLSTALVDMFARCGDPSGAIHLFEKMTRRDVSAWTAAIGAMAMQGNGSRAIVLFNEMLREGVKPDPVVFAAVLTACSHGGLVEQGQNIFYSMEESHGISHQIVHYGCMVDLLGRAGRLPEALNLIQTMPMESNEVIWASFLASCRMHKNVELAAYAAERLTKFDPKRTGMHVVLSNIYASAGKWADVAKVRLHLKEKGVKKVPGCSSIEINGHVHEFTSGDESHSDMVLIASMLDEMSSRARDAGHVPDQANVLLNVDEHEKEYLLSRHSEKLAMAYGLICSNRGSPIRVVKNLRICSDCHSFARVVSKIYDREIIIRDIYRFHIFQKGVCSCNNYW